MIYGVTAEGFVPKPRAAVLADLEAAALLQYGPSVDVSSDSVLGIDLGLTADALATGWEQSALTYAQAYPDGATGASFANLARFTACDRLQPTTSLVDVQLVGTPATVVPAGTVFSSGSGTSTVATVVSVVLTGTDLVRAAASETGPQLFPASTINTIDTPVPGLTSVTQPNDEVRIGTNLELETAWRARREVLLRASGGGALDAIRARVLANVPEVSECHVYDNDSEVVDPDGLPPHSFEVVARHPTSPSIAQALFDEVLATKPGGIYCHGTTVGSAVDTSGALRTVRYSRPTAANIYCDVLVTTDGTESSSADLQAAVRSAIVAQESRYLIGNNVVGRRLALDVFALGGLVYDVLVHVGLTAHPTGDEVVLNKRQAATFDTSRIGVLIAHASDV